MSFRPEDATVVSINENAFGQEALHVFKFDKIFQPQSTQEELYEFVGTNIVADAFSGYNSTVLAYGQTGSGKTHTMFGKPKLGGVLDNEHHENGEGIIPRVAKELFQNMNKNQEKYQQENTKIEITL